jgi:hypothetical protein
MTILEALIIFGIGWSLRGEVARRFCLKCATRTLLLTGIAWALKKPRIWKWLLTNPFGWRIKATIMLVYGGPTLELIRIIGWKNLQRMVNDARTTKKTTMP